MENEIYTNIINKKLKLSNKYFKIVENDTENENIIKKTQYIYTELKPLFYFQTMFSEPIINIHKNVDKLVMSNIIGGSAISESYKNDDMKSVQEDVYCKKKNNVSIMYGSQKRLNKNSQLNIKNILQNSTINYLWLRIYEILDYYKLLNNIDIQNNKKIIHFNIDDYDGTLIYLMNHYSHNVLEKQYKFFQCFSKNNENNITSNNGKKLYRKFKQQYNMYKKQNTKTILKLRKKYIVRYKLKFNLITLCNNKTDIYWNFVLGICLCSKGTNFIFQINKLDDINISGIIYLSSFLFENVYISVPVFNNIVNNSVYCVCMNFLYEFNDNVTHDTCDLLCKWWDENQILSKCILNGNIFSDRYIDKIHEINKIYYTQMIIGCNYMYFKYNNKNNKIFEKAEQTFNDHIVNFTVNSHQMNITYNKLGRVTIDIADKHYLKLVYPSIDPLFLNDNFMYYMKGKNYILNYKNANCLSK
jgi:hypothetical protein